MENTLYLASSAILTEANAPLPYAQLGFGFSPQDGQFIAPIPTERVLVLNDSTAPSAQGLQEAEAFFRETNYDSLVCDFEQPYSADLATLLTALRPERLIVPPQYAGLPHQAVFLPPYRPLLPFSDWLCAQKRRFGAVVLDMQPISVRFPAGHRPEPVPRSVLPHGVQRISDALCCVYCSTLESGRPTFYLFDTVESYRRRIALADAPCVVPEQEYYDLINSIR